MSKSCENIISAQQKGTTLQISVKIPQTRYLNSLMRANCFPELWDLFRHAHSPAKEFTESYSALEKLRKALQTYPDALVCHVGDGAHCRTGAMFAFMTKTMNVSIDPIINTSIVKNWHCCYLVQRFGWIKDTIENTSNLFLPDIFTFVHAHVNTDEVLTNCTSWKYAYISACCFPSTQLSRKFKIVDEGYDWGILSEKRQYQVIKNEPR